MLNFRDLEGNGALSLASHHGRGLANFEVCPTITSPRREFRGCNAERQDLRNMGRSRWGYSASTLSSELCNDVEYFGFGIR